MRIWLGLCFSVAALAASGGGPAVYVVGNLEGISPGAEGMLVLENGKAVFRSGKTVMAVAYADIGSTELGTKLTPPTDIPLYKVWQLHKRFLSEKATHQLLTIEFSRDGKDQTMTLELEETAAAETLESIEIKQGKRQPAHRSTNADSWWGDSAWKTTRNSNTVNADTLGHPPVPTPMQK